MNADKFFEQYSVEIINKRTRISPISLRYIKNKEFDKIQRVKFLGFVKIIEKEFNIDLSDLIEEYNNFTGTEPEKKSRQKKPKSEKTKKNSTFLLLVLTVALFSIGAYLLYKNYSANSKTSNITHTKYIIENNKSQKNKNYPVSITDTNITKGKNVKTAENNTSEKTLKIPKQITIIPNKKLWFMAINTDNNKTVQYLTSHPKTLQGADWYVKLGHGDITIIYGDQNITPKTKKIVRILFEKGKYKYMKKPNRYEK